MAVALALGSLAMLLDGLGTSGSIMLWLMRHDAPESMTGLPDDAYPAMTEMITDYLAGHVNEFSFPWLTEDGNEIELFHDYEQAHMYDVASLFRLDRSILAGAAGIVLAAVLCLLILRNGKSAAKGFLIGTILVLLVLTVAGLWAVIDFDGLFILFHRLSFSNRLWLLDPSTDLLIRLMPTAFFIHYAAMIGAGWSVILLAMLSVSMVCMRTVKDPGRGAKTT